MGQEACGYFPASLTVQGVNLHQKHSSDLNLIAAYAYLITDIFDPLLKSTVLRRLGLLDFGHDYSFR
jgi:hypothetical protein